MKCNKLPRSKKWVGFIVCAMGLGLLFTQSAGAQNQLIFTDDFDDGILDTAWTVTLRGGDGLVTTTGWDYDESVTQESWLTVRDIYGTPSGVRDWKIADLSRVIPPVADFNIKMGISWASPIPEPTSQRLLVYIYDGSGTQLVAGAGYNDSWGNDSGTPFVAFPCSEVGQTPCYDPSSAGYAGNADIEINRTGDVFTFTWEGTNPSSVIYTAPIEISDAERVELSFSASAAGGYFGTLAIDYFTFEGEPVSPSIVTLASSKDSFLRQGNVNRNEGANPRLRLRATGNNRAVMSFDAAAVGDFVSGGLSTATLALNIAENANNWGQSNDRTVDAHPLLSDFAEGDGQNAGVPGSQSTRGNGPGVTWKCAVDDEIGNQQTNCDPTWDGGDFGAATASPVVHFNGLLGEVTWDVTDDVLAGANAWLVKKTDEGKTGKVLYHSREGADDAGDPDLAPQLILER